MLDARDLEGGSPWAEALGLGRSVVIGCIAGAILCFVGVAGALAIGGQEIGSALGLGLFVGLSAGLGFGGMVGGVVWASRHEDHA